MTFESRADCWNSILSIIEHSEKYKHLTPIQMQSLEAFNINIVYNFLIFPTATHKAQSD
jgi:hypothetical protein